MKNVLLATTALVAIAGAASAELSWSGDAGVEYNTYNNFSYSANLAISATAELNDGVTAGMTWGASISSSGYIWGDYYPVITLESSMGKLSAGNADAIGPASDHFSATSGVSDFSTTYYTSSYFAVRADATLGGFDVSVSEIVMGPSDLRVGASGSFGAVDFGIGYAQYNGAIGLNVGTMVGGADIAVSYYSGDATYGIEGSYAVSDAVTVGAYYASTGEIGASLGYAAGAITADLAWDNTGTATIDGTYDMGNGLMLSGGYDNTLAAAYLAANYDLGNGAAVYAAYSSDTSGSSEIGPDEWAGGITVGASMEF